MGFKEELDIVLDELYTKAYKQGRTDVIYDLIDYVRINCKDKELEHFILSMQIKEKE